MLLRNLVAQTGTLPKEASLKAKLMWKYLYEDSWTAIRTSDGHWICMDDCVVSDAEIYDSDAAFLESLELAADDYLRSGQHFLENFVSVEGLVDSGVAEAMRKLIDRDAEGRTVG